MEKIKILRVVTNESVVPWHLHNTLERISLDSRFEVVVAGNNVECFLGKYKNIKFVNLPIKRKPSIFSDLFSLYCLIKLIRLVRPDIVHSIMPKAGFISSLAAYVCRVDVRMHTFTGQMWNLSKRFKFNYLYWLDRITLALNSHCLTDSKSQSEYLLKSGFSCQGKALDYLCFGSLSGVDLTKCKANIDNVSAIKKVLDIENSFVFIYLARKCREKGAFDALEMFSKFNKNILDSVLLFVGPDDSCGELDRLKKIKPHYFKNVISLDQIDNKFDYLCASHVLLLPSYREGFGSVVIDAASVGVPTIGSSIVGLVDAIDDKNTGILFPCGDIDAAVSAMRDIYQEPSYYQRLSENAIHRVSDKFNADFLYFGLIDHYISKLKGNPHIFDGRQK